MKVKSSYEYLNLCNRIIGVRASRDLLEPIFEIVREGGDAFLAGISRKANPYKRATKRYSWDFGWRMVADGKFRDDSQNQL